MVSFNGSDYIDSAACLNGFPSNHQIIATILNSGGFTGFSLEVELHLRSIIEPTRINLYEVDCVFGDKEIDLVRWDGSIATPNAFTILRAGTANEVAFNTGDQVLAKIVGTLITVMYKPFGGSFAPLFAYDISGDSVKYMTGNPGMGAWNETGDAAKQPLFAWSDYTATALA